MPVETLNENALLALAAQRGNQLEHDRIVLYAGANLPSEEAQSAYSAGLSAYPAMGPIFKKEQPETAVVSRLEVAVRDEICRIFSATWAEPRLPSCTFANMAIFHAFTKPGDVLLAPSADHGGHLSQRRGGTPDLAGLDVIDLPFNQAECQLDAMAAAKLIHESRPKMVLLGRSVMIKPDDVAPVVRAAKEVGTITVFDASHVSGLIAGGTFPNPLLAGIDIMTSSTYKTIAGRPHSIIAGTNPQHAEILADFIDQKFLANYDAGKLPSMLVTLREVAQGSKHYANAIVAYSRAMAATLHHAGIDVIAPQDNEQFTHQVLVPIPLDRDAEGIMKALERNGILVGLCRNPKVKGQFALRIGTQFLARKAFSQPLLDQIASKIKAVLA